MADRKYLNEEMYLKNKKRLTSLAVIVLIIGLLIGGSLVGTGIVKYTNINSQYSDNALADLNSQLDAEKQILENKKNELENKGITYDTFAKYTDGDTYDYKVIVDALDTSFPHYKFDACKNNEITSKYCELKNKIEKDFDSDFNKSFDLSGVFPYFIFGGFIIIASFGIFGSIIVFTKRREIVAFTTQQIMPVAKEGIEEIAPSIGQAAKNIAKDIKSGLNDDK